VRYYPRLTHITYFKPKLFVRHDSLHPLRARHHPFVARRQRRYHPARWYLYLSDPPTYDCGGWWFDISDDYSDGDHVECADDISYHYHPDDIPNHYPPDDAPYFTDCYAVADYLCGVASYLVDPADYPDHFSDIDTD
jgi:hypothetical protein